MNLDLTKLEGGGRRIIINERERDPRRRRRGTRSFIKILLKLEGEESKRERFLLYFLCLKLENRRK